MATEPVLTNEKCRCRRTNAREEHHKGLNFPAGAEGDSNLSFLDIQSFCPPAWYCVRTQPKHEHIAAATLTRQLGFEVFHPRLRLERATRRGVVRIVEPLFPCYLFVRFSLGERMDEIRYANGVSSLVHFGEKIPNVPEHVIEELRQCFETEEPMSVQDRLYPGAEVTVAEGAFLGFSGIVVRLLPARRRVQILLEFLGRTTIAEVERTALTTENRSVADLVPMLAMSARMIAAAG